MATAIHYPVPIHRTGPTPTLGLDAGSLPVSEALAGQICSLPIFPGMTRRRARTGCERDPQLRKRPQRHRALIETMDDVVTTRRVRSAIAAAMGVLPSPARDREKAGGKSCATVGRPDRASRTHARAPTGADRGRRRRLRLLGPEPRAQLRRGARSSTAGAVRPRPRASCARSPAATPTARDRDFDDVLRDPDRRGRRRSPRRRRPTTPLAKRALLAGKHVLVEKPLATHLDRRPRAGRRSRGRRRPGADARTHVHLQPGRQRRARPDPRAASSATCTSSRPRA